jgi:PAS domain S-box-containing protein
MFTLEMIEFFEKVGNSIGISLERKRAMEELINYRKNLEKQVDEKTAEIKKANKELKASNQQLEASNQQLRAAEQQLRASNQELRGREKKLVVFNEIIKSMLEGVYLIRMKDGIIVYTNTMFEKMFGYNPEEMIGKQVSVVNAPTDKDPQETAKEITADIKKHGTWKGDVLNIKKDGTKFWCHANVSIINHPEHGKVFLSIHTDITDRKRAEEEKEKMQLQLLQSQKMEAIGTLAGGVAHDFNNLLTTILGNANLTMNEIDEGSSAYSDLKEIATAASRAANLTRQLLLFSRKQPMGFYSHNVNSIINNLLKMLERLIGEDISINLKMESELWNSRVDEGNIEQVITNLVINARDAMAKGGEVIIKTENITLDEEQCKTISKARPGKYVRISVEDNGIGMDNSIIPHIFEPFYSTKGPGKGSGLGLSVIYGIIEQHKGWINVYSELGKGSVFRFCLPASSMKEEIRTRKTILKKEFKGKGERILLIEDDPSVLKYTEKVLVKNGYTLITANNAEETLRIFNKEGKNIDLIISDMVLPDKTGLELVNQLLKLKSNLSVIFSSGYLDDKSQWDVIQEKGYRFLQKPFEVNDLLSAVRETLDKNK